MDSARLKEDICTWLNARKDSLAALSADIFNHPETGLNEERTAAVLSGELEREGFVVDRGIAGLPTAFSASYGTSGPGIALLAEMDALPGLGHACGHNLIGVAAVGAAMALKHFVPADAMQLKVFGTPAEELGIGKFELVKAGCFRDLHFAMMVHPSSRRTVIKGYLGLAKVRFTFFGTAAHAAAYPEEGVNALDAVIQTFNAVNALRQQTRQDVRIHGIITEGGTAPNIIPARAQCYFYVRAEDLEELARLRDRVVSCAQGAATSTGCRIQVDLDPRVLAPLRINRTFSAIYSEQLKYLGLAEALTRPDRNRGSSDIGNVSQVLPTIHPHVPIGEGVHIHTEQFAQATVSPAGNEALLEGAKALALTACELIARPELQKAIWDDFSSAK